MKVKFKSQPVNLLGNEIKVGDIFPSFKGVNLDMSDFEFDSLPKTKKLILSIPSIDTGVCEMETTKFMHKFAQTNYPVVAVSQDLPFAFNRWCAATGNKTVIPVSEFRHHDFALKTGTLLEGIGLLTRAVFVLDENNKVLHVEYLEEVGNEPDYDAVMKFFN
ncbi:MULTISPECIES: thiol peroxidase [unclassified Mycoplasma]|uniref:thiol peroxidase n=1 Tax=unclassified Mycoplasma TaxID=2683645 RepID=UPI00216B4E27|nr:MULTISPECIES: thiol peroxidase [unclassified Mycoplasma]MCS4537216.1 thiol peroxidase [Mycoplasma sp. CSL7475-4]MCT4470001.1 thiol peroxidase [Mycoplasma sp. HS2188]